MQTVTFFTWKTNYCHGSDELIKEMLVYQNNMISSMATYSESMSNT